MGRIKVDLEKLKRLREQKMTLEDMSHELGYKSPNGYYYLEKGRSKISAEALAQVAEILDIEIGELFTYTDEES